MKITVTQEKKEFRPFVLTLEIENEDELIELYNRFNPTEAMIKDFLGVDYINPINPTQNIYEIFKILDDKLSDDK